MLHEDVLWSHIFLTDSPRTQAVARAAAFFLRLIYSVWSTTCLSITSLCQPKFSMEDIVQIFIARPLRDSVSPEVSPYVPLLGPRPVMADTMS